MAALSKVYGGTLAAFKREPRDPLAAHLVTAYGNASREENRELATGCYYLLCVLLGPSIGAYCVRYQQDSGEALEQLLRLCIKGQLKIRATLRKFLLERYRQEQSLKNREERFYGTQPTSHKPAAVPLLKSQENALSEAEKAVVGLMKEGATVGDLGPLTNAPQNTAKSHWNRAKKNLQ
jgi:DNA-binding NarL/FixJ family response regulator